MRRRVAVTGIGWVTPLGWSREHVWQSLLSATSGIKTVQSFDTSALPVHIGAEITDFSCTSFFRRQNPAQIGRGSQLAVAAAKMAMEDAGIAASDYSPRRSGVCLGTTSGEAQFVEQYNDARKASRPIPRNLTLQYPCNVIPSRVATEFDLQGPCLMIPAACAAGNFAIGYAFDLIRSGDCDLMLAGGADPFSRITYIGFARLGAIAPLRCQPFDRNRKGMIPGEGAAILVLEELSKALARGALIYAEILGYGLSCDAYHMSSGHPRGDGAIRAMQIALQESGVSADDIGYISAHGTGTPTNDRVESQAIGTVFGRRASKVPVSSIKSMIGHTMGAASAIEAAVCALALQTGFVPPTMNYEELDPECPLDCVPNRSRKVNPRIALNNAYAFGGGNACVCMARYEGRAERSS